jgi:hypothetical protein
VLLERGLRSAFYVASARLHLTFGANRYRAAPVRAAVRTLTLNLYALEAPGVQAFLAGPQAAPYFTDLGAYMTERCQVGH